MYTSRNTLGPSILLYRNGFLKKWVGGWVEEKKQHEVLSSLNSRFGYAGINKNLVAPLFQKSTLGRGRPSRTLSRVLRPPLHTTNCGASQPIPPSDCQSVCLSVYLRTSALARAPLPTPLQALPPPINFWSHALNRTQALHRPVTDYDSISGTNSFYVTCPTAHFEFIPSSSTSCNAPSALSVTPALVRSLPLSLVYDRKWKLLTLRFTQRKPTILPKHC